MTRLHLADLLILNAFAVLTLVLLPFRVFVLPPYEDDMEANDGVQWEGRR
ncbi:MAG: hypothetical protein HY340_00855 [Candidatus Kerfeldbacteria bacterium]|nr:hypothetical protein [Candidatus Kerfeldbacteria bacterium]